MRILVSCLQSQGRHPIPAYDFWRTYFVRGLEEAGHDVLEVPGADWAEGLVHPPGAALDLWRERIWESVLTFVRAQQRPVDLLLSYLYPKQVEVGAIQELQNMGVPCVNFFCDNVREFRSVPAEYRPFALHWVPEFEALPMYGAAGLPHVHAAMPCWIPLHLRNVPATETEPPTFIGSADILRRDFLGRALQVGADFVVRGSGWTCDSVTATASLPSAGSFIANQLAMMRSQGPGAVLRKIENRLRPMRPAPIPTANVRASPVGADEYFRLTREATVTIGLNRVPTARASNRRPLRYSRLRDVEAPMLGACYLTEWAPGLDGLFELGKEIEVYRTAEELSEKLAELKSDPARRLTMRKRAQKRALGEHSVARSIGRIAAKLQLPLGR